MEYRLLPEVGAAADEGADEIEAEAGSEAD